MPELSLRPGAANGAPKVLPVISMLKVQGLLASAPLMISARLERSVIQYSLLGCAQDEAGRKAGSQYMTSIPTKR